LPEAIALCLSIRGQNFKTIFQFALFHLGLDFILIRF